MESGFAGFKWTVCPAAYVQVACSRIDSCPEIARVFIQSEHGNFRSHLDHTHSVEGRQQEWQKSIERTRLDIWGGVPSKTSLVASVP